MTEQKVQNASRVYVMHPLIRSACSNVYDWFDSNPSFALYQSCSYSDAQRALERASPRDAAFNFHYYFATHYFKACHALQSDSVIGLSRLAFWLRHNPYLTIIDVGCGDGAGSVALIDSVLRLKEKETLGLRPIQLYFIGIDPNPNGLCIYEKMLEEAAYLVSEIDIEVDYAVCPSRVFEASGHVNSLLYNLRRQWYQPSLSHALVIEGNLNDLLAQDQRIEEERLKKFNSLKTYQPESFGHKLATFYYQVLEEAPLDHLHIISIDTEPMEIQETVEEMLSHVQDRFGERGHTVEVADTSLEEIIIQNPKRSFWRKRKFRHPLDPFVVSVCHAHSSDVKLDTRWQQIASQSNLELAWARVRQEMLRESFSDEIEIRLFEWDLASNLDRLHRELNAYAVAAGYPPDETWDYTIPKNPHQDRPRGLTWFEEEVLMIAIVQVIGTGVLRQSPHSYAYRLSPANSLERGQTEYLYERWTDAWESFRQDVFKYVKLYQDGVVIETDIKSYYTRILQDRLAEMIKDEFSISKRIEWLLRLLIDRNLAGHDPGKGLVQGSVGSGFLANVYLTPLDTLFPLNDHKKRRLFRYVDDVVIVIPDKTDEEVTREHLLAAIDSLHLECNVKKTRTYSAQQYLEYNASDEQLDQLQERYEQLVTSLWNLNEALRTEFKRSVEQAELWWNVVSRYRSCIVELGFYITTEWLSRKLSTTLSIVQGSSQELEFPDLPPVATIAASQQWAKRLESLNPTWSNLLEELREDLRVLVVDSLDTLVKTEGSPGDEATTTAQRRLRFAVNRLGLLGLRGIHLELTNILCETPWLVRDQHRLIADLARQGYSSEIWQLIEFHRSQHREMSAYMSAVAVRALRFLPRLEANEWRKLTDLMFSDKEVIRLMATETWLVIVATLGSAPLQDTVYERVSSLLASESVASQRLLKNYLLVLGTISPKDVGAINVPFTDDWLVAGAYDVSSRGMVFELFKDVEPEVLRQKYYGSKYNVYDDRVGGSPFS